MAKRARTDIIQLKLRIRESLRARLAAAAKHNGVSLNSEIAKRLEASVVMGQLEEGIAQMLTRFEGQSARPPLPAAAAEKEKK